MLTVEVFIRKQVAVLLLTVLMLTATGFAQQTESAVNVRSNPSGCTVILSGDMTVAGITPTTFGQKLRGYYTLTAHLDGFETYHSSVLLPGQGSTEIDITLSPKTRAKAGFRSLLVPGWGQIYSGSKTKGVLLTVATLAAGVTAGIFHLDYADKRDAFLEVEARYNAAREVSKREAMLDELYEAQKDANDAEETRLIGFAVLAGVWAYNVIDAVVFFPDYGIHLAGTDLSVRPEVAPDGVKLVGVLSF